MWAVGEFGELYEVSGLPLIRIEKLKEIGNHFETEEEAEKAVEKLKAWKRLREARLKFTNFAYELDETTSNTIAYHLTIIADGMAYENFTDDLALLFGGEE